MNLFPNSEPKLVVVSKFWSCLDLKAINNNNKNKVTFYLRCHFRFCLLSVRVNFNCWTSELEEGETREIFSSWEGFVRLNYGIVRTITEMQNQERSSNHDNLQRCEIIFYLFVHSFVNIISSSIISYKSKPSILK